MGIAKCGQCRLRRTYVADLKYVSEIKICLYFCTFAHGGEFPCLHTCIRI